MQTPTHSTIDHWHSYRAAMRAMKWQRIQPASKIVGSHQAVIKHFGTAY